MKFILILLSLVAPLTIGHAGNTNGASTDARSYAAGGTPIVIPPPSTNLVEAGNDRGLMEVFCPNNNRLIACFLASDDLARVKKGGSQNDSVISRYAMVEVPRRGEYRSCAASDFKEIEDGVKEQFSSRMDSVMIESEDALNRRMKELDINDVKMTIGKPLLLGIFFSKQDACGSGMMVPMTFSGTSIKMAAAMVLIRVKERVLFVYLYADYKNEDTIKWLRATSEKWADAILKANRE